MCLFLHAEEPDDDAPPTPPPDPSPLLQELIQWAEEELSRSQDAPAST